MPKAKIHLIQPDMGGQHTNGGPDTYCRKRSSGPNPMVGCGQWPRATCSDCLLAFADAVVAHTYAAKP